MLSGTISNTYSQRSGVLIQVSSGVKADFDVDLEFKTISIDAFNAWRSNLNNFLDPQQIGTLDNLPSIDKNIATFLASAVGLAMADNIDEYIDKNNSSFKANSSLTEDFLQSIHSLQSSSFRLKGQFSVTGLSDSPAKIAIFFVVTTIEFDDGHELSFVDSSSPMVAESETRKTDTITTNKSEIDIFPSISLLLEEKINNMLGDDILEFTIFHSGPNQCRSFSRFTKTKELLDNAKSGNNNAIKELNDYIESSSLDANCVQSLMKGDFGSLLDRLQELL